MITLAKVSFVGAFLIASIPTSWALAQSTDDPWAKPLNLSHSGIATNPAIVSDAEGALHALWQDDLGNYLYSGFDGHEWSAPETTDLNRLFRMPIPGQPVRGQTQPLIYTGPNPLFIAGLEDSTFAFWISPLGRFFASKGKNPKFEQVTGWDSGRQLAPEAASFAVAVDASGELHVAFLRTLATDPANPAGIYYTRSKNGGRNWAEPVLLYESDYLRKLREGEANLSIATTGTDDTMHVYVAWDNRPRKQVLLAQSTDSGKSWGSAALIAGPSPDSGTTGPFNIQVGIRQNGVVLVWQKGEPGGTCSQIYQSSKDAGTTWSDPQTLIDGLLSCTQTGEFVTSLADSSKSQLYFLIETKNQVFLTAWNGLQWSQPQVQQMLSGFEEPEIYTEVVYGCHRAVLSGQHLYVIGCDQGTGGDIWVTSRDLGSDTSGFKSPEWSILSPVTNDKLEIAAVELVSTDDGLIHAFISKYQDPVIYYAYWDGESWSRIRPVLKLPDGEAAWPSIAAGPGNELFLIARNNKGTLYSSRATSGNAATESRWSTPTQLEIGHDGAIGSVAVTSDLAGTLYVAYSVPLNNERGIYLVQSKDHGTTWSEPLQVFDGAAAGFDLVGPPSLLLSDNGSLHLIWKQESIQGDGRPHPLSVYYSQSEDGGHTFSAAEPVVQEPVAWDAIATDGKGNLHLLWQPQDTTTTVWDQVSSDGGRTWQYPKGLPIEGTLAAVTRDSAERLHLVGIGSHQIGHWLWGGSTWQAEAPLSLPLSGQQDNPAQFMAAVVSKQGKMMVLLAIPTGQGDVPEQSLLYSTNTLELPPKQISTQQAPTQTLSPPTLTPATATPEPLFTATTLADNRTANPGKTARNETNDPLSPFTMALLPVALLLLSVLGLVIWRGVGVKDR